MQQRKQFSTYKYFIYVIAFVIRHNYHGEVMIFSDISSWIGNSELIVT